MAISDIPGLSALRTSMQWHQQRQRVLAENVANADTPNFQPRDLVRPTGQALVAGAKPGMTLARTNAGHIAAAGGDVTFRLERKSSSETRPAGNAVSLDDEMLKVAQNQMDYQAATSLYTRSLGLLKTAMGKR
jgi:flagellar basal-body rod protein FlgB